MHIAQAGKPVQAALSEQGALISEEVTPTVGFLPPKLNDCGFFATNKKGRACLSSPLEFRIFRVSSGR
jgi:hypothetical protein